VYETVRDQQAQRGWLAEDDVFFYANEYNDAVREAEKTLGLRAVKGVFSVMQECHKLLEEGNAEEATVLFRAAQLAGGY
jgi:hypothetical protein